MAPARVIGAVAEDHPLVWSGLIGWAVGWPSGLLLGGLTHCVVAPRICGLGVSPGAGSLGWLGPLLVYGLLIAVGALLVYSLFDCLTDPEVHQRALASGLAVGGAAGACAGWFG